MLDVVGFKVFIKSDQKGDSSPIETFFIIPPVESDLHFQPPMVQLHGM